MSKGSDSKRARERLRVSRAFGSALREIRKSKGLTQEGLALAANLDRSYVGAAERGERNITLFNVYVLADTLGVKTSALLETAEKYR